jgi:hypothetical protein
MQSSERSQRGRFGAMVAPVPSTSMTFVVTLPVDKLAVGINPVSGRVPVAVMWIVCLGPLNQRVVAAK